MQILHDERRRGGDADAIEVGDDGEEKREPEDADTDAGRGLGGSIVPEAVRAIE